MSTLVGIDAGGTKTHVLAVDNNFQKLAEFTTEGADISTKPSTRVEKILQSIRQGLLIEYKTKQLDGVALGLPGFGEAPCWTSEITRLCQKTFRDVPYEVYNDVRLALEGAFEGQPGVIVLSGTGSMIWAKDDAGNERRVGGWGTLFGDEGSSYMIGISALRAVSRHLDGRGPETALSQLILHRLGKPDLWNLREYIDQNGDTQRATIASFSREVSTAADTGDIVALNMFTQAATELVEQVEVAFEQLHLSSSTPISCAGGTFNSRHMRKAITGALLARDYAPPIEPRESAAYGGVLLAKTLTRPQEGEV